MNPLCKIIEQAHWKKSDSHCNVIGPLGPNNVPVTYDYDAAGRLATIATPTGTMVGYGYDNRHWNNPIVVNLPGGSSIGYDYDPRQRVESIVAGKGSQQIMSRVLGYSPAGNILSKTTEHGNYTYGYDNVYRLQSADNAGSMTDEAYTYDNADNRVSSLVAGTWTYNKNNALTAYTGASSILYDNNGSLTRRTISGVKRTFVYDGENRLASVKNASLAILAEYGYDPFGRRLWKKVGTASRVYYFYSDEGLIGEYDEAGNELRSYGYIPGSQWSSNPVFVRKRGQIYFLFELKFRTDQILSLANRGLTLLLGMKDSVQQLVGWGEARTPAIKAYQKAVKIFILTAFIFSASAWGSNLDP